MRGIFFFLMILMIIPTSYAIDVTDCMTISSSGTYVLQNNITGVVDGGNATDKCIHILSDDVILDCDGYWINDNVSIQGFAGVWAIGSDNVTVQNCNIYDFAHNVRFNDMN